MTRPRGKPPMPSARSSESEPVDTAPTDTCAASLMRITDPLPNCRSICPSATSSASSRFIESSSCDQRDAFQHLVPGSGRVQSRQVSSRVGRNECSRPGQWRLQTRPLAEAKQRDVRQPPPRLRPVDAERFQAGVTSAREPRRGAALIGENEHPDAPRLAPARGLEHDRLRPGRGGVPQDAHDRVDLRCRAAAEERERDVQVLPRDDTAARQVRRAPGGEVVQRGGRKLECEEEPKALIASDATRGSHTSSCRLGVRTRRARCSAPTVARERTVSRSAGSENSPPRSASGVDTWKYTSPTGFSSVPPSGPATPVTATPTSTASRSLTPVAIASATSAETAPCASIRAAGTPSSAVLTSFPYATIAPAKTSLEPGTSVRRAATSPPVHDSAVASRSPRARQRPRTISATDCSSWVKRYLRSGSRKATSSSSARASEPGSTTRSTWISKSRAQIVASTPSPSPPASARARATADSLTP